jgi:hypothetical protein
MLFHGLSTHSLLVLICLNLCVSTCFAGDAFSNPRVKRSIGTSGVHVGAALEWYMWGYSVVNVSKTIGYDPRSYGIFTQFPLTSSDLWVMQQTVPSMGAQRQSIILTVEPFGGLRNITSKVVNSFIKTIKYYEDTHNATFIIRFGHEMNGSWYPWCQKPVAFKSAFRRLALAVKKGTKYATMMFAPNIGVGYPYTGGQYQTKCNEGSFSSECKALDTNKDGFVTENDDMFSPYWPGDDVVDWVGSSLYWWGIRYPWGENNVPTPNSFYDMLMGNIQQDSGAPVPEFYVTYSEVKNKPMIISETSALYNLCDENKSTKSCEVNIMNRWISDEWEFKVKSSWWDQIFSLYGDRSTYNAFPNIRMICWFNIRKKETEVGGNTVDWTTFSYPSLKKTFIDKLQQRPAKGKAKYWITNENWF